MACTSTLGHITHCLHYRKFIKVVGDSEDVPFPGGSFVWEEMSLKEEEVAVGFAQWMDLTTEQRQLRVCGSWLRKEMKGKWLWGLYITLSGWSDRGSIPYPGSV